MTGDRIALEIERVIEIVLARRPDHKTPADCMAIAREAVAEQGQPVTPTNVADMLSRILARVLRATSGGFLRSGPMPMTREPKHSSPAAAAQAIRATGER